MLAGDRSQGVVEAQVRHSGGVADAQSRRSLDVAEAKPRRIRGAISPASIVASLAMSRIVCIGTYSILCTVVRIRVFMRTLESNLVLIVVVCCASCTKRAQIGDQSRPFLFYRSCVVVTANAVRRRSEKKKNKKQIAFRCKTIMHMRISISTLYFSVTEYTTLLYSRL